MRASEIRTKLADIAGEAELTDEQRSDMDSMRTEYADNERKQGALVIAGDGIPEPVETTDTELDKLIERASVGNIFTAACEHRATSGAERELQAHHDLASNFVPLSLLETRAVTPAPGQVGQNQQAVEAYVFPNSVAAFLGIAQPTVPVGDAVYPALTSKLTVGTPAENAEQAETTGAFAAEVLTPGRLQASFLLQSRGSCAVRRNVGGAAAQPDRWTGRRP